MRLKTLQFICIILALNTGGVRGEVTLPSVISDGVVFQRNQPIVIRGRGLPGESVKVTLATKSGDSVVGADSTWSVTLPAVEAGGPYTLTANDKTVEDVLVGDLYLCSGQSNMELPVNRVLDFFREEAETYNNPMVREFKTPKEYAFHGARDDVSPAQWKRAVPGVNEQFGALVWFMAHDLYEHNGHVPVGVINSSWGGSRIDAWLSEDALKDYPVREARLRIAEDDTYRNGLEAAERRAQNLWYEVMNQNDPGYRGNDKWNSVALDDSAWPTVSLLGEEWGSRDGKAVNGSHWLRRHVNVASDKAGEPAELRLGCIVDADSVWVNGQFVGFTAYQYPPRIYKVPAGVLKEGDNVVTVRVVSNAGIPHFVEEKPHKFIFSDGSEINLEGDWLYQSGTPMPPTPPVTDFFQTPSVLYNGLISPMLNFPFRGVVWYQGESDVDISDEYASLMKSLMADWREKLNDPDLPFFIVELADFLHPSDIDGRRSWEEMRKAQREAAEQTPKAWWILNGDVGEWNDIHPRDKKTPGMRVAKKIRENPHR